MAKKAIGTVKGRAVLGAATFGFFLGPWSPIHDEGGGFSVPNVISMTALVILVIIRIWYALSVEGTRVKQRHARIDVPMVLAQVGLIVPLFWVLTPWLSLADYKSVLAAVPVGSLVYLAGLWICWRAHADLGTGLSPTLDIKENHVLVTTGVYGSVRHPMYVGFLLYAFGQLLVVNNLIAGPAGLLGVTLLIVFRIQREEEMMMDEFGDDYAAYRERTSRLVPGVW